MKVHPGVEQGEYAVSVALRGEECGVGGRSGFSEVLRCLEEDSSVLQHEVEGREGGLLSGDELLEVQARVHEESERISTLSGLVSQLSKGLKEVLQIQV